MVVSLPGRGGGLLGVNSSSSSESVMQSASPPSASPAFFVPLVAAFEPLLAPPLVALESLEGAENKKRSSNLKKKREAIA